MKKKNNELKKPGPDANVLEIEEYEKRKNMITVNIYDGPARLSFVYGLLSSIAAVVGMVWNFVKPIKYVFMPGYEGFFYVLNIYRIVTGYLFAAAIVVFAFVAINLYKKSAEASPQAQNLRKAGFITGIAAAALQPISAVIVTVQALEYFNSVL